MSVTNRICSSNLVAAADTTLTASSAQAAFPVSNLRDQLRSKTWRSAVGWTIDSSNNKIDFNRGGVKVATVATGTYATGATMAAAVVAALTAADAGQNWGADYGGGGGAGKFGIWGDNAHTLLWATGANASTNCAKGLGFNAADTASAVSHSSDNAVYQSRHWLQAAFSAAWSAQSGIVINHNSGASGTYTLQLFDAAWGNLGSHVLAGDANIRIDWVGSLSPKYVRLIIDDCGNGLGYGEVGLWHVGAYTEPPTYMPGLEVSYEPLSAVAVTPSGAHWVDEQPVRRVWSPNWRSLTVAQREALAAAFYAVPYGKSFFFSFDAVTTPTSTHYVFLGAGFKETLTTHLIGQLGVPALHEALG